MTKETLSSLSEADRKKWSQLKTAHDQTLRTAAKAAHAASQKDDAALNATAVHAERAQAFARHELWAFEASCK